MPEHHHMPPLRICVVAILCALALASCGGSSSKSVSSATGSPSAQTTATTTATPTQTVTQSTPFAPAGTARCVASKLALSFLGQQGATGHGELGFSLRNTSKANCHTFGYPGVVFLDQAGQPLPTVSTRTTHDFFGQAPAEPLIIAPGGIASFRLGVTHGIASSAGCVTAHGLQVIPPDDTATLHVSIPQGAFECGKATVSPLRPGQSAYP
jgi:hypothetical protein